VHRPKDNLPHRERRSLKDLTRNKHIFLEKADKGTATVIVNRHDRIKEGQCLLDDRNNYWPLVEPIIESTPQNVQQLVKYLSQKWHIDSMTEKWLSFTPRPPRTPGFYTLTKIRKPTLVGRPIISGCDGPTECIWSFVDRLVQPIAQSQDSYHKNTTDFTDKLCGKDKSACRRYLSLNGRH